MQMTTILPAISFCSSAQRVCRGNLSGPPVRHSSPLVLIPQNTKGTQPPVALYNRSSGTLSHSSQTRRFSSTSHHEWGFSWTLYINQHTPGLNIIHALSLSLMEFTHTHTWILLKHYLSNLSRSPMTWLYLSSSHLLRLYKSHIYSSHEFFFPCLMR